MSSYSMVAIDDLLEIVSPSLLASYETINLNNGEHGPMGPITLERTNEEYKNAVKDQHDWPKKFAKIYFPAMMIVLGLYFVGLYLWGLIASIPFVVVGAPVMYLVFILMGKENHKFDVAITKTTSILESFRRSIEALRNPNGATDWEYTPASIRNNFFTHAVRILDGERKLDAIRMQKERLIFDLLHICKCLNGCQEEFETATREAKKFGLEFDNRELFAEAKKHLDRQYV